MSIWRDRRKAAAEARKVPALDPMIEMEVRVARRICAIVYGQCQCKGFTGPHPNVCDVMQNAAQAAIDEILHGQP